MICSPEEKCVKIQSRLSLIIKQRRKLKANYQKPSIWGNLDLNTTASDATTPRLKFEPETADAGDRL